jgi:hypothetical protein
LFCNQFRKECCINSFGVNIYLIIIRMGNKNVSLYSMLFQNINSIIKNDQKLFSIPNHINLIVFGKKHKRITPISNVYLLIIGHH